ncbi:hypothetical protein AAFF_G00250870 [Aldrovandia affinis]|uniref:Uncharacterized protein n=1 Tax=Aldrovandia affinis TaxID=143900 RepID=A0AAD7W344_9TELE|nr:hypothetical protein AAFF_G00250870 [Aldrovandia affinis]
MRQSSVKREQSRTSRQQRHCDHSYTAWAFSPCAKYPQCSRVVLPGLLSSRHNRLQENVAPENGQTDGWMDGQMEPSAAALPKLGVKASVSALLSLSSKRLIESPHVGASWIKANIYVLIDGASSTATEKKNSAISSPPLNSAADQTLGDFLPQRHF